MPNVFPNPIRKVYFLAICGTGMGSLAGLLKAQGYEVAGSDQNVYPPMSDELKELGIPVFSPFAAQNLKSFAPDLVVVGNAVSKTNVETEYLVQQDLAYVSMPQALKHFFLYDKEVIMVAGTHGKTTTTAVLAHLLYELKADPSFLIGGVAKNFGRNFHLGKSKYFVIEGDEYDTAFFDKGPKFLHYNPRHTIITSLEFDHADIYRDLEHVIQSFKKLIGTLPKDGSLHSCDTYPRLQQICAPFTGYQRRYGTSSEWQIQAFKATPNGSHFDLHEHRKKFLSVSSPLTGKYNAENVAACFSVLEHLGFSLEEAHQALQSFQSVKRRQEVLFTDTNWTIIDDFAHHPTAVQATIEAIKEKYPQHHLVAVFEPRSNTSRTDIFQQEYTQSFLAADTTVLAGVNQPEKVKQGSPLNVSKIVADLKAQGRDAHYLPTVEQIIQFLLGQRQKKLVILIMSNGSFGGIYKKLLNGISN